MLFKYFGRRICLIQESERDSEVRTRENERDIVRANERVLVGVQNGSLGLKVNELKGITVKICFVPKDQTQKK